MKTKTLLGLVAVVAVAGFAASAQAGWSVSVAFPVPVYAPPVAYYPAPASYYAPPVAYCPPPVAYCPPPVRYYAPPVRYCPPRVVYVAPRYERHSGYADYRGSNRGHGQHGRSHGRR